MNNSKNKIKHEIQDDGIETWRYSNEYLHQNEDIPALIHPDGTETYFKKGKRFREIGPAVKRPNGNEQWDTKKTYGLHRTDGAARVNADGRRIYRINGKVVTYDKFKEQN